MKKEGKNQTKNNFFKLESLFFVGTDLYQKIEKFGKIELKKLDKSFVKQDLGKDYTLIDRYHEFIIEPNHLDYSEVIYHKEFRFYNMYQPFTHELQQGECPYSLQFIQHIFGEQYELGLDYLKLLFEQPKQLLPILSLVSKERETGKTTFLNWLKAIFGLNMTINRSKDMESNFNSDWANKLLIAIDETFLEKKSTSEMIKNVSTAKNLKMEGKGKDRTDVEFFGKIILSSNNVESFVQIDKEENRYWVRYINKFSSYIPDLEGKLKAEIPAFLYHLHTRTLSTQKVSRTWFSTEQIWTPALEVVKEGSRSNVEKELETIIVDSFDDFEVDTVCYTEKDLIDKLKDVNVRVNKFHIAKIIKENWSIYPREKPSTYTYYTQIQNMQGEFVCLPETRQGKFFTFEKSKFEALKSRKMQNFTNVVVETNIQEKKVKNDLETIGNQLVSIDYSKKLISEVPF